MTYECSVVCQLRVASGVSKLGLRLGLRLSWGNWEMGAANVGSIGWLVGRLVGPGWNMQLCIFKFMFLHLPLLRLARSLAPRSHLRPIAVNRKLQQFSMTRLDWSRRRELHSVVGDGARGDLERRLGNSGGLGLIEPHSPCGLTTTLWVVAGPVIMNCCSKLPASN